MPRSSGMPGSCESGAVLPHPFHIAAHREKENVYLAAWVTQRKLAKAGGQGPDLDLAAEGGTLVTVLAWVLGR